MLPVMSLRGVPALAVLCVACEPYAPPCELRDHRVAIEQGFTPDLQVSGTGEVWATGWQVDDDDDPSTQLARVATFTPAGEQLTSLTVEVPVLPSDVLGTPAPLVWVYTGTTIAAVRRVSEVLPPDDDGEHVRSTLSWRSIAEDGTAAAPVELVSCDDCQLSWAMRAMAGRVAVVYRPRPLTADVEEPLALTDTHYLLVDPDGQVFDTGTLAIEATEEDVGRFDVDTRGRGFWLATPDGMVLYDEDMQPVGGPYATDSIGPTPMDMGAVVNAAWVDEVDNVFRRSYRADGRPLDAVNRVTHGTPQALRAEGAGLGMIVRDEGEAFFTLSVGSDKVGGDMPIPGIRGGWPSLGALFVDGAADFELFMGDKNQVDRLEVHCAR